MLHYRKEDVVVKKYKVQNASVRLFIKTFFISVVVVLLLGGIGWLVIGNTVRPPVVPNIAVANIYAQTIDIKDNELQNYTNKENYGLIPPSLIQFEERRPSFFTFLIFGLTEGLNANTIMVAAYDAELKHGYIISIPRDTQVDMQRNSRKIVSAYLVGRLGGRGHDGGVERMKYEVATLVGFKPDFYIGVDYDAFVSLVNAVGGVEIYVPFHMLYDDPYQNLHINLQQGLQLLDGEGALHFSRYRTGNDRRHSISDYRRIEHQQQVLTAVFQKLLTPSSILRIPELISIFNDYIKTDLAATELLWFANQARTLGGLDALQLYTLPMLGTSGAPNWYELPHKEGILELVNRTVNPLVRNITEDDLRISR